LKVEFDWFEFGCDPNGFGLEFGCPKPKGFGLDGLEPGLLEPGVLEFVEPEPDWFWFSGSFGA
jgi:hypothetical protein